jgi:hypothetical protein
VGLPRDGCSPANSAQTPAPPDEQPQADQPRQARVAWRSPHRARAPAAGPVCRARATFRPARVRGTVRCHVRDACLGYRASPVERACIGRSASAVERACIGRSVSAIERNGRRVARRGVTNSRVELDTANARKPRDAEADAVGKGAVDVVDVRADVPGIVAWKALADDVARRTGKGHTGPARVAVARIVEAIASRAGSARAARLTDVGVGALLGSPGNTEEEKRRGHDANRRPL